MFLEIDKGQDPRLKRKKKKEEEEEEEEENEKKGSTSLRLCAVECLRDEEHARSKEIEWEKTRGGRGGGGGGAKGRKSKEHASDPGSRFARSVELERLCWTLYARQLSPSVS